MRVAHIKRGVYDDINSNDIRIVQLPDGSIQLNDKPFTVSKGYLVVLICSNIADLRTNLPVKCKGSVSTLSVGKQAVLEGSCRDFSRSIRICDASMVHGRSEQVDYLLSACMCPFELDNTYDMYEGYDDKEVIVVSGAAKNAKLKIRLNFGSVFALNNVYGVTTDSSAYIIGSVTTVKNAHTVMFNYKSYLRYTDESEDYLDMVAEEHAVKAKVRGTKQKQVFAIMAKGTSGNKFVKSISIARGSYALTPDLNNARQFKSEDEVREAVDFLVPIGMRKGVQFVYDVINRR